MSANPFLFTEEDYLSPTSGASNPFLVTSDCPDENPFASHVMENATSTNPFAFDPMELETSEPLTNYQPYSFQSDVPSTNSFIDVSANSDHNFFSVDDQQTQPFETPQKPTDLNLKYTNTVASNDATVSANERRLPPPRPPPSKETQDLLMSVMGAMDATSSHLLDRIPPTRTPSPVSVRDLHSPSPTPEATFGDLLDVSDAKTSQSAVVVDTSVDLMSLSQENTCDINQNPPLIEAVVEKAKPVRPGPPVRPPRPQPPKPPPPTFANPTSIAQPVHDLNFVGVVPPKPAPPVAPVQNQDDEMDMFGVQPQKTVASNADILNLYKTSVKSEPVKDLLFDVMEPEIPETVAAVEEVKAATPIVAVEEILAAEPEEIANVTIETPEPVTITQDAFSPEQTTNENLYMDTSDSQSKGSISSITLNPFAANDDPSLQTTPTVPHTEPITNVFEPEPITNAFEPELTPIDNFSYQPPQPQHDTFAPAPKNADVFDAFAQKFESAAKDEGKNGGLDAFLATADDTWGNNSGFNDSSVGFETEDTFDAFLAMRDPPVVPQTTPNRLNKFESQDSEEDKDFSVVIKPTMHEGTFGDGSVPVLAPPPVPVQSAFTDSSPRFNPFDQSELSAAKVIGQEVAFPIPGPELQRTDSQETPPTPLFDDDVSQPLLPFPRTTLERESWEMQLRQPNKKKITGQRFWKKIFIKIATQADCVLLQLFNQQNDKDPFQELPLQPCYSVSDISTQQYDQYGKIFTIKLQYIFYKERPGVRPGQVKKAERITNKLSQFAAYAIQGDYQGVKEFGSDLKKLGLPVEHAPQVSQLMKLGSLNYEDLKEFSVAFEEALFLLQAHRDRVLHYKMEEVQVTAVDELYVEQSAEGHIEKQIARVRLFFLGFLTGMPDVELGVNDMRRQGKEVVGRHDIIPVVTEEWIRLENVEFHSCVQQDDYNDTHIIKFKPPDACYIELLRFRIRPPKNRELPLQLKAQICITGTKVELRADVLVPGFASRKLGQVPCEDVMIRFPIPECWIYMFRVEKHFRYGSVKSAHRRTGKIKGIERILGTVDTLQESLIEVTSGQAKYEHQHRAIVWRCPRLPKEGQGAYTTHNMVCRLALTSFDQMPPQLAEYCYVEFTMPATQASHTTVRSVSLQNSDSDEPPEKYVRYLARHEYRVGIEHTQGEGPNAYSVATTVVKPAPVKEEKPQTIAEAESSSDSD